MLLTRETTDHNFYANHFMTRNKVYYKLCKSGLTDGVDLKQIRQVGRTPEYNLMLIHNMKRYLEQYPDNEEISLIYATYGLPWPGRNPQGPLGAPHPWIKEVYHENAFNNYLSFKRYTEASVFSQNNLCPRLCIKYLYPPVNIINLYYVFRDFC